MIKHNFLFLFFFSFLYFCSVVERELNVPLPISKIIKKWNNLLQEYKVMECLFYRKLHTNYELKLKGAIRKECHN